MCISDQKEETLTSEAVLKTFLEWKADTVEATTRKGIFLAGSPTNLPVKVRIPYLTEDLKQDKEEVVIVQPLFLTPTEVCCVIIAIGKNLPQLLGGAERQTELSLQAQV